MSHATTGEVPISTNDKDKNEIVLVELHPINTG
jgi:hypothetical protein